MGFIYGLATALLMQIGMPESFAEQSTTDVERAEETVRLVGTEAARYRLVRGDDPQTEIELRSGPILKWSNIDKGPLFGSVVLWAADGRPEVVASMYRWYEGKKESHAEFTSLSAHPLKRCATESRFGTRASLCSRSMM
jgi:hypothetical protein